VPLPHTRLLAQALPREGKRYLAMGYPTTKTKPNTQSKEIKSEPFANYCRPAQTSRYTALGVDPIHNIVLDFDRRNLIGKSGQKRTAPDTNGMSGAPIWLLADERLDVAVPDDFQVAAILTDHRRREKKALIGTDIGIAIMMMAPLAGIHTHRVEKP
jgi:hypothetical protein